MAARAEGPADAALQFGGDLRLPSVEGPKRVCLIGIGFQH
jgi:hypothetical protein